MIISVSQLWKKTVAATAASINLGLGTRNLYPSEDYADECQR